MPMLHVSLKMCRERSFLVINAVDGSRLLEGTGEGEVIEGAQLHPSRSRRQPALWTLIEQPRLHLGENDK